MDRQKLTRSAITSPWSSFQEWDSIRKLFWSTDPIKIRQAVDHVMNVWIPRGAGSSIPPAVESTASFFWHLLQCTRSLNLDLNSQLIDASSTLDDANAHIDEIPIRLGLSAAIIRFVNETVDPLQQSSHALPITKLAESLKLPRLAVDLRHASTHDRLPCVELLAECCQLCLFWLRDHYWMTQLNWKSTARQAAKLTVKAFVDATTSEQESASFGTQNSNFKQEHMLARSLDRIATRFLVDLPHVEFSCIIQDLLIREIIESFGRIDLLSLLVEAIVSVNERIFDVLLRLRFEYHQDSTAVHRLDFLIGKVAQRLRLDVTVSAAANTCALFVNQDGISVWQMIAKHCPDRIGVISSAVASILQVQSTNSTSSSRSIADLEKALSQQLKRPINQIQDSDSESASSSWSVVSNWKPVPLGCTSSFDIRTQWSLLYNSS